MIAFAGALSGSWRLPFASLYDLFNDIIPIHGNWRGFVLMYSRGKRELDCSQAARNEEDEERAASVRHTAAFSG